MYFLVSTTIWNLGASLYSTYLQLAARRPLSFEVIFNQRASCSPARLFPMALVLITIFTALNLAFETVFPTSQLFYRSLCNPSLAAWIYQTFVVLLSAQALSFLNVSLTMSLFFLAMLLICPISLSYFFAFYQYKCKYWLEQWGSSFGRA